MAGAQLEGLINMVLIIVAVVALIPFVLTQVGSANWTVAIGGTTLDLAFAGLLLALIFVFVPIVSFVQKHMKGR